MYTHEDLSTLQNRSLKLQGWIRQQTFSPEMEKTLRRFSSWEVSELIFNLNQSTFRGKLAADPSLPAGEVEPDGRQRWFSLDEINELRRRMKVYRKSLMPPRPAGKRAFRVAVANFKGGAGKSTVTKLLLRLFDLPEGEIKIDKQDIAKVTQESLRNAISFVPQQPILFHRSLMENIRYGRRDAPAEEVIEAAKKAHCHELIPSIVLDD